MSVYNLVGHGTSHFNESPQVWKCANWTFQLVFLSLKTPLGRKGTSEKLLWRKPHAAALVTIPKAVTPITAMITKLQPLSTVLSLFKPLLNRDFKYSLIKTSCRRSLLIKPLNSENFGSCLKLLKGENINKILKKGTSLFLAQPY